MKTFWDARAVEDIAARIDRLHPEIRPRWGRMNCPQMVVHITDALALYMGELQAAGKRTPLQYAPLKQLCVYLIPIPRNVPTAPELLARVPGDWQEELTRLRAAVKKFAGQPQRTDWPAHPIFGSMSCRAYGALAYRHTDHHLRQFGV